MATTSKTSTKAVATAGSSQLGPSKPATSSSSSSTAANKALQQSLNAKGANLKVDGIIGPLTQAAQAQFGGSSQKTAQFGDKGQYTYNVDAKGNPFGSPIKTTSTIATTDMKTPPTPLPAYNMPNIDGKGIVTGIQNSYFNQDGTLRENVNPLTVNQQNTGNIMQDYFTQLIDANNNRQSQAELYREAQKETDILNKQKAVSDLSGQLQQITAQGQANQLSVVGQGRGIPEAIIGGQQAQFARETAIQALPVAASLSAAQGNLEMANNNLNTLFSIKSADAKADYDFKTNLITSLRDYATKQEDKQLDYVLKLQDRQYQETQALNAQAQAYAKMAFENNQSTLGSKIASLDYKSPTFKTDLAKLTSKIQDPVKTAQLSKLNAEISALNNKGSTDGGVNQDLTAYASQYADTGKLPSPAELKLSGLSVGQVTAFAKQIPQAKGAVVSIQTGTKSSSVSATAQEDFQKLYNITEMTKRLKELDKKRVGGVVSGALGKVFGSEDQGEYLTLRKAIVDEMSRMQSGAALTPDEIAVYNDYLPGRWSESFGLGQDSLKKINNFESAMTQKLDNRLANNGLSIYGYSKVKVGNTVRNVGDIVDIGGVNYRVLPDGTLTDIL